MAKNEQQWDDDEPAFVPGKWYMFGAPGGFTMFGQYVRPLGMGAHRFRHATHMRNAGQRSLPEICRKGPGPQTLLVEEFPRYWNGTPIWWADYLAKQIWVGS